MKFVHDPNSPPAPPKRWNTPWVEDLAHVAARDRWGIALGAIGWIHLAALLTCQWLHSRGDRAGAHFVGLWGLELFLNLSLCAAIAGRRWYATTPLAGLIARIWGTFLILSFNLASLNTLSGLDHEWFKPALATLSAFGFMMMAYVVDTRFLAFAVQMYFTGLLMRLRLDYAYLVYGLSWWAALQAIGISLHRRRGRGPAPILVPVSVPPRRIPLQLPRGPRPIAK